MQALASCAAPQIQLNTTSRVGECLPSLTEWQLLAYLVPVVWLAVKQTVEPLPQVAASSVLQQVSEREHELTHDQSELAVRALWQARAEMMQTRVSGLPDTYETEQQKLRLQLLRARANDAPMGEVRNLERELAAYPKSVEGARMVWSKARDDYAVRATAPQPMLRPLRAEPSS